MTAVLTAAALALLAGATLLGWHLRRVTLDPRRYLAAVVPLGGDPRLHRLASAAVARHMRRRGLGMLAAPARHATAAAMSTSVFAATWALAHQGLHLTQRSGRRRPVGHRRGGLLVRRARATRRRARAGVVGTALLALALRPGNRRVGRSGHR